MRRSLLILLAIAALTTGSAVAADMLQPPVRDLVHVYAAVTWATAQPGGANEGSCFIANATSGPVRVSFDLAVVFADGTIQKLTGIPDPGILDVGGAFEQNVFFIIPEDAAVGPASFVCDVRAQARGGRPEWEAVAAGFEVVP